MQGWGGGSMRLKRNTVRIIRILSSICCRGLVPPGDFLAVDLREGDMIVVVWWVKERKLTTNKNKDRKTKRLRYTVGSILEQNHPYKSKGWYLS
jgi:hypothetical protein